MRRELGVLESRLRALAAAPVAVIAGTRARVRARVLSTLRYAAFEGRLGRTWIAYGDQGLCCLTVEPSDRAFERWFASRYGRPVVRDPHPPARLLDTVRRAIDGERVRVPVDLRLATPFQRRVLGVLRTIPRGSVRSYRWVARQIGKPRAVRAVGSACASNPVPLVIPCHRVVRSDGSLGGYSLRGGTALKRRLLVAEGATVGGLDAERAADRRGNRSPRPGVVLEAARPSAARA